MFKYCQVKGEFDHLSINIIKEGISVTVVYPKVRHSVEQMHYAIVVANLLYTSLLIFFLYRRIIKSFKTCTWQHYDLLMKW